MNRLLALLTLGLFAGAALADVPPPPPPKGKKYVNVSSELKVEKGVTGYVFVLQEGYGPGRPTFKYKRIEPTADKAVAIPGGNKYAYVSVFAVPEGAAKGFKTDDELFAALSPNKVKGAHSIGFATAAVVPDSVKGDSVKWTYTVTGVDEKGIGTKVEGEGYAPPAERPGRAPQSRGGAWVAGLAAALALMLGGFWLAGRTRRKA